MACKVFIVLLRQLRPDALRVPDEAGVPCFVGDDFLHFSEAEGAVGVHRGFDAFVSEEFLDEL
jgi:hypothetical protein